jgi:hypothetical protein
MVFNATFNNILAISWRSVLLVEETGIPGKNPLICRNSMTNFITKFYQIIKLIYIFQLNATPDLILTC